MANATVTEAIIILGGMVCFTAALVSGKLDVSTYSAMMGMFLGYTVARIFNHVEGKE